MKNKARGARPEGQLLYEAFRASPIGVALEGLDGRLLFVNPALCSMLGFTEEELLSKHCVDFSPAEDAEKDWALFRRLQAGSINHYSLDKRYFRRDGSLVWGHLSISLLRGSDSTSPMVLAMVEDITEKKTAEEGLLQAQRDLELVTKEMAAAVARCSHDLRYLWANQGYADLLQRPLNEIVGRPILEVLGAETFEAVRPYFERVLAGETVNYEREVNYKGAGREWISATFTPTLAACGGVDGWVAVIVDITDRKRAEEAIHESEKRYRRIVETTNEGVWLLDATLHNSYVNRQMAEMLGYEPDEMIGRSVFDFYFTEDAEHKKQVLEHRQQGWRGQIEERLRRKDGSELWVRVSGVPLFKENEQFDGALAMVEDITGRRLAERELSETNERLRLTMEAGGIGGLEWDIKSGRNLWFGQKRALGIRPEVHSESIREFWDRVHPEDRGWLQDAVQKAMENHAKFDVEFRVVWPDGSVHWLGSRARFFYDASGEAERMLGTALDITDRKLAEETLSRHAAIIESSQDAIISKTLDGIIQTWNPAAERIYGYTEAEAVGQHISILAPPELRDEQIRILEKLKAGERLDHLETTRITNGGEKIDISLSLSPIKDSSGRVVAAAGTIRDITQRKQAEEALSKVSQKLIQAQEHERSRLARELHDDINQRLSLLAVTLDGLKKELPATADQFKQHVSAASAQVADLGKDIQALSHRLHSPKLELLGLAAAASSLCKEFSRRQNVEIDFQSENILRNLRDDISLTLYRILQEALQNAVKHSGSRHFRVSLVGGTNEIELTVQDSGVGFEPDEAVKGSGLGLASMKERMKLVGGELSIDSQLQHGTTIRARVPFHPKRKAAGASGAV